MSSCNRAEARNTKGFSKVCWGVAHEVGARLGRGERALEVATLQHVRVRPCARTASAQYPKRMVLTERGHAAVMLEPLDAQHPGRLMFAYFVTVCRLLCTLPQLE